MDSKRKADTDCLSADQQLLQLIELLEKPVSQEHW